MRPDTRSSVTKQKGETREVRGLIEVARDALLYGYYFYPLYALEEEQLYRSADAAILYKCKAHAGPEKASFGRRIDWLYDQGMLDESERGWWHAIRKLRNHASHPWMQRVGPPGPTLSVLNRIVDRVNSLFGDSL